MPTQESFGIGQLARRGGVGIDTVRYYERNGLLGPRLRRMRAGLAMLIAACPGHGKAEDCPILKALGAEEVP